MRIRTIMVDDDPWSILRLRKECQDSVIELEGVFKSSLAALAYVEDHAVEMALLDVKMPDMDGIALGRKLKRINHDMIVIYITGYEDYVKEAVLEIKADHYLLKPYNSRDIALMFDKVKRLAGRLQKRVLVRTFGEFDIFIDGRLIEFTNRKAKELFAVCIDIGGEVTMKRIIDLLWEDRNYDNKVKCLYRKAVAHLNAVFRSHGVEYIFCSGRGKCYVNRQELSCDYYEVLEGKNINETLFDGGYMSNYSWGEETCGKLCRMASGHLPE